MASSHFVFIRENPHLTPHKTDLFARGRPNQADELNHFTRVLISTISEFSATERAKYPPVDELPKSGKLFSDGLLDELEKMYSLGPHRTNSATHNPLSSNHQEIEYWAKAAQRAGGEPSYSSGDGDLADAVKMLIIANEMPALLRLANHPQVPLHKLNYLSWGHSFGFNSVAGNALWAYLFLNIADAVKFNAIPESSSARLSLFEMESFRYFTCNALADWDFPAQNIPHRAFWLPRGVEQRQMTGAINPLDAREDREEFMEYLKMCFGILYRYDVLMRECGVEPDWTEMVVMPLAGHLGWGAKFECKGGSYKFV